MVHATSSASADRPAGRWAFSSQTCLHVDRTSATPVARQRSPPNCGFERDFRQAKTGFRQTLVTGSSLPRSGVTSVDRFPSRAELAATTLPPRPELQCPFAFAVSLKARPPFTFPRPTWLVAGKCFSGPDTAYPHLQHNTTPEHNHEGDVLVRKGVAISLRLARLLPATSAQKKLRLLPGAPPEPGGKPAEPIS